MVTDIKYFSKAEKETLKSRMTSLGLAAEQRNALMMWGGTSRRLVAIFDVDTLRIKAFIKAD
jgi:hypothetical protein